MKIKAANKYLKEYRRNGGLTERKLREYIPAMMLTNLSTLLLLSVDGIVAGNFVGQDALSCISIFYPVSVLIGFCSVMTASGISTSLSTAMGRNDTREISRVRGASLRIMILMAVVSSIVQIPLTWFVIKSYGLDQDMYVMTWQYAVAFLLCAPFSLVNTVGIYQLQIAGKMKMLMKLSLLEGLSNLVFDLLFTGALHMGIAGTGAGSACACLLRFAATVWYISRNTDFYKGIKEKLTLSDVKKILGCGLPEASYSLILAFQNYFVVKILLGAFGSDGGVIRGVCTFCWSLTNVMVNGIQGGMRPLMGLLSGADDRKGLSILMIQGMAVDLVCAGAATALVWLAPTLFYQIHGVDVIPEGGLLSLRLFSLYFVFRGLNALFRLYLSNRMDSGYATWLTVAGNAVLPLIALLISVFASAPYIFLSYLLTELIVLAFSFVRYIYLIRKDRKDMENSDYLVLSMTVKPDQAVEASRRIRRFAEENGISRWVSYRVALCMEEMVAYVKSDVEVLIKFEGKNKAAFVTLDDGECIALNDLEEDKEKVITNNYAILRKVAKTVDYQYILNMNYTRITIEHEG